MLIPLSIGWLDIAAPVFWAACWVGYSLAADVLRLGHRSLKVSMYHWRERWMLNMLDRDNRMIDLQVVAVLVQNVAFFASSAILITGGGVAVLGANERAMRVIDEIPFAASSPQLLWDLKVLLLIVSFTYAFFKFTWSIRQFNYAAILIGAAPPPREGGPTPEDEAFAKRTAKVVTNAGDHFNRAMRAYYFGLAALAWFIQPWLLMATTLLVLWVVWRREYRSNVLGMLMDEG